MKKFKFGVIGTGMISGMFREAVREVPGAVITAVLSRNASTGDDFVRSFFDDGDERPAVVTTLDELFRSDIDAVYVASPNRYHAETSIEAMKAGFDVLCEKPIASNLREYDRMTLTSEKTGRLLLEAMRPAFDPGYVAVRNNLSKIGPIRHVSLEYCQYSSRYDRFKAGELPRAFDPTYSNAAVMDIGVYPIYVSSMLFGMPEDRISSSSVMLKNGMEGGGEVILPYSGMNVAISYSKICDSVNPSIIIGEEGSISIDKLSSPSRIVLKTKGSEERVIYSSDRTNNMRFEIGSFIELSLSRKILHEYGTFSAITVTLIDEIRRQNGIVFPTDDQ